MKTILLGSVIVGIGVCAGLAFYMSRTEISPSEESSVESQVRETETAELARNSLATGFEAALNLEPSNWDARFTKAVAMSYWPTQMNKGTEVMQHFVTLVEQQEAQPPKPHFVETYVWLGQEYQKYGYAEEAEEIWQRGAALFPQNQELRNKLLARP